jgi:hypothetical protein
VTQWCCRPEKSGKIVLGAVSEAARHKRGSSGLRLKEKETLEMVSLHMHVPYPYTLLGIVLGVAVAPISVLGTLFVVVKTALGY